MKAEEFKVLEWLRKTRDDHFEETRNKTWEEDRREISAIAEEITEEIRKRKTAKTP